MLLFYSLCCGIAWYYGGGDLGVLVLMIIATVELYTRAGNRRMFSETTSEARLNHAQDGMSHLYYQMDGKMLHEEEYCSDCAINRSHRLQEQGARNMQVILGCHSSGELIN